MRVFELPIETKASTGFTHKITLDHTDLTNSTDAASQTITLLTVPARSIIKDAATNLVTPFQLTGTAAYNSNTIVVGISGTTNQLIASQQINANGTPVNNRVFNSTAPVAYASSTDLIATVASMASYDLAELDAGEIHIFLSVAQLGNL